MKLGFSLGMCVSDLVKNKVRFEDVLVLITGTALTSREDIKTIVDSYGNRANYWLGLDLDACQKMTERLWDHGKILQPRLNGIHRHMVHPDCIWADVLPSPAKNNAALTEAWEQYRMLVDLTGDVPEGAQQQWVNGI